MLTVTASTSVVLVATSVNAPTEHVVLFPQLSNIGRLITVRDNDGQASLTNPIIMSTMTGTTFTTGNQIKINQPFGFVTVTTQTPTTYSILNTFAFPAEQAAANLQTLTAQTINVSTIQFLDTSTNLPVSLYSSTNQLIYNNQYVGDITNEELQSTVVALGTIGYLSTIPDYFPIPPVWVAVGISSNNAPTPNAIGNPQGTIQYSTDSIVWRNAANNTGFTQYGTGAVFDGKGMFVAVGANRTAEGSNLGYIKWSYNGSNWQDSLSPYLSTGQERTAVSYANGYYHAVGYNPNGGPSTIMWSLDGRNYTPSQGNPFSSPGGALGYATGITYGAGVWVCSGAQDALPAQASLLWSVDGTSWNPAVTACWTGNEVYDVDFDGTNFIALTKDGLNLAAANIARSSDGKNWSSTGFTGGSFNNLTKYVTGNGQEWVATTGDTNKSVVYSLNDGTSWSTNANIATCNVNMYKPYFDGSKWLMGVQTGGSQSIYYSGDAQTWYTASIQSQFINGGYARGFASSDGLSNVNLLLASTMTGLANNFTTSTLAVNTISTSIINADTIYSGLAYVSSVFIGTTIVSTTYETVNNISTQNVDFISAGIIRAYDTTIDTLRASYEEVSTIKAGYISAGQSYIDNLTVDVLDAGFLTFTGAVITNIDVENISASYEAVSTLQGGYISSGVLYGGRGTIQDLRASTISTSMLYSEKVGINVAVPQYSLDILGNARVTNYNPVNRWVSVGFEINTIAYSDNNGVSWTGVSPSPFSTAGIGIAWNGSMWVAGGEGSNTMFYSYDGINWLTVLSTPLTAGCEDIAWNGSMWIAVGQGPSDTIAYSYDGLTWIGAGKTIFDDYGYGVAWNGSMWVAVGKGSLNTIAYSYDGINWIGSEKSIITTSGYAIAWNGSMWIAVGSGTNSVTYSYDGINWFGLGLPFIGTGYCVAWNGSIWIVGGGLGINNIIYSFNGINWYLATSPFSFRCADVAWNGTKWIAVGQGTNTMAESYDGITWSAITPSPFTTVGLGIAYSTNLVPTIKTDTLNVYSQNVPVYLESTNQILATNTNLIMNSKLYINTISSFVGINTAIPQYTLDINGSARVTSSIFTNYISSGILYGGLTTLENASIGSQSTTFATVSSLQGTYISAGILYGGTGTIDDLSTRFLSASQENVSSIFTNYISAGRIEVNDLLASSITYTTGSIFNLNVENISANRITASTISTSFLYSDKVAIGLSTAQFPLDVNGSVRFTNNNAAPNPGLSLVDNTNTINFYPKLLAGQFNNMVETNDCGIIFGNTNIGNLVIANWNNNTYGMKFMSTGNTGINTASPLYPLDVNGIMSTRSTLYVGGSANTNMMRFYGTNGDGQGNYTHTAIAERIYNSTEESELLLFKGNDTTDRVRVLATGGFQVDVAPVAQWDVGSAPPAASVANCLVVNSSGNVGIRNSTPAYPLDVNGTAKINGDLYGGGMRVTDITNQFYMGHSNLTNFTSQYGFRQSATAYTNINCGRSCDISFSQQGNTMALFQADTSNLNVYGSINANVNIKSQGTGTFQNVANIGKVEVAGDYLNWAYFGHSNYHGTNNFAIAQGFNAATYVNSIATRGIGFSSGGNLMGYFDNTTSNLNIKGSVLIERDGDAGKPSLRWSSDIADDTGFYHPGDGIISASINGTEMFRINNSGINVYGVTATNHLIFNNINMSASLLKYIPFGYLIDIVGSPSSAVMYLPLFYTGQYNYKALNQVNIEDYIMIGPRVEVSLSNSDDGSKNLYTNYSSTDWSYLSVSPVNTANYYYLHLI
jgi:hypothetical protein